MSISALSSCFLVPCHYDFVFHVTVTMIQELSVIEMIGNINGVLYSTYIKE